MMTQREVNLFLHRDPADPAYWPRAEDWGGKTFAAIWANGIDNFEADLDMALGEQAYNPKETPTFCESFLPDCYMERYDQDFLLNLHVASTLLLKRMHRGTDDHAHTPIEEIIGVCIAWEASDTVCKLRGQGHPLTKNIRMLTFDGSGDLTFFDFLEDWYSDLDVMDLYHNPPAPRVKIGDYSFDRWFKPMFWLHKQGNDHE